jgi:hypothetical protein
MIFPVRLITIAVMASTDATWRKSSLKPMDCFFQTNPPFDVRSTVPFAPTIKPLEASRKETAYSEFLKPGVFKDHVAPPFVVVKTDP